MRKGSGSACDKKPCILHHHVVSSGKQRALYIGYLIVDQPIKWDTNKHKQISHKAKNWTTL